AHKDGHAAVGGAIENEVDRALNWAVYFCDFGKYQNPLPLGPTTFASDANISYKRSALDQIKEVWTESFHETVVNAALLARGQKLWLSPNIVVYQHRENLRLGWSAQERFVWGRSYAGTRAKQLSIGKRIVYLALSPALTFLLVARKVR